jgi:hypothetical protein
MGSSPRWQLNQLDAADGSADEDLIAFDADDPPRPL